jgi:plastocyanin
LSAVIIIPNGNVDLSNSAFYKPLNLEITSGTVVTWMNEDSVEHTIQSQDESGNNDGLFHSSTLGTGETLEFTFEEMGFYNYYCSFHPWRVGLVTVK